MKSRPPSDCAESPGVDPWNAQDLGRDQVHTREAPIHGRRPAISQLLFFDLIFPLMCVHHVTQERWIFGEGASRAVIKLSPLTSPSLRTGLFDCAKEIIGLLTGGRKLLISK